MTRKDEMLMSFLRNEEFVKKFNIDLDVQLTIPSALSSGMPALVALAKIINKYEEENTTPLYQQVVSYLNQNS
jgi:hypothetical protein